MVVWPVGSHLDDDDELICFGNVTPWHTRTLGKQSCVDVLALIEQCSKRRIKIELDAQDDTTLFPIVYAQRSVVSKFSRKIQYYNIMF